jgi:putative ABC transport system permease protein
MRDVRLALRYLLKSRGYTLAVVLTLAVAIGANTAIFSAVYGVLLKPLPIVDASKLVVCWDSDPSRNLPVIEVSYRQFESWAAHTRIFRSAAAVGSSSWPEVLDYSGTLIRLPSVGVSQSFFETFGVRPLLGRTFQPADDLPGAPHVVVISHGLWTRMFGANPAIVGATIKLDQPSTIVGVMPEGFDFPRGTDVWRPVVPILADSGVGWQTDALENVGVLFVVGRLLDDDSLKALSGELDAPSPAGAPQRFGTHVVATPFAKYFYGPVREALLALFAAVALLLLIACANVSGLMLTRVFSRRQEDAVRLALGATRGRLGRQWALETGLLFLAGGVLGVAVGQALTKAIVALAPADVPRLSNVAIDARVASFTILTTVATALLCGLTAVRHASTTSLAESLNTARSTDARRTIGARSVLVVLQIAFSLALTVTAVLVLRSFVNLRSVDLGFAPDRVLSMNLEPRGVKDGKVNLWVDELLRRVAAMPGVEAAGAVYLRPLALGPIGQETGALLEGQSDDQETRRRGPTLNYEVATPGYFSAMRIRLVKGRLFNADDRDGHARVAIVGETAAKRLWPGLDPIGQRLLMPSFVPGDRVQIWRTVVGVVSDVSYRGITDMRLDVYDAALQAATNATDVVVRSTGDPRRLVSAVQAEARRLDAQVVVDRISTMDAIVDRETAAWRFSAWVLSLFGAIAFLLAGMGLFGLVSMDVAERRPEFAIRVALGAQRTHVLRLVLVVAGWRVVGGLALGVLAAAIGARVLQSMLFGVTPSDAASYAIGIAVVLTTVAVAAYVPARRAAAIDPLVLLRRN